MKIQIKINHQKNGEQTLVTLPADLMKWERITSSKMTDLYEVRRVDGEEMVKINLGFEDLMAMAWAILNRTNQTTDKFDAWANELEEIELVGIDETNPPQTAVSDEQSPILPSQE
jgi:hypothetical protein